MLERFIIPVKADVGAAVGALVACVSRVLAPFAFLRCAPFRLLRILTQQEAHALDAAPKRATPRQSTSMLLRPRLARASAARALSAPAAPAAPAWRPSGARVATRLVRISLELGVIYARMLRGVPIERRARKMREAFVRLGPAFVKVGQALATLSLIHI